MTPILKYPLTAAFFLVCIPGVQAQVSTNPSTAANAPPAVAQAPTNAAKRVLVYYFHRTGRCHGCLTIEQLTRKAVNAFRTERPEVDIFLQVLNLDDLTNEHFIVDFKLSFNTVVIAEESRGTITSWTNLSDQVWGLYADDRNCLNFLKTEIERKAGL